MNEWIVSLRAAFCDSSLSRPASSIYASRADENKAVLSMFQCVNVVVNLKWQPQWVAGRWERGTWSGVWRSQRRCRGTCVEWRQDRENRWRSTVPSQRQRRSWCLDRRSCTTTHSASCALSALNSTMYYTQSCSPGLQVATATHAHSNTHITYRTHMMHSYHSVGLQLGRFWWTQSAQIRC